MPDEEKGRFTIRVYGLLGDGKGNILLSDEFRLGTRMTKFPGGGLEYGEGPVDCLKRECHEELGQPPVGLAHLYTTDYFQPAMLLPGKYQVLNIYYTGLLLPPFTFRVTRRAFDWPSDLEGVQRFRWRHLDDLAIDELTLPIDRRVIALLKSGELRLT